jgi:hypothetical protein
MNPPAEIDVVQDGVFFDARVGLVLRRGLGSTRAARITVRNRSSARLTRI